MGLTLRLEKESLNNISSHKDSYMNRVFDFKQFKGCKSYVDFINKEKFFTYTLTILEAEYFLNNNLLFKNMEEFEKFCMQNELLIHKVKNYPNVNLKRKYMRLSDEELEVFEFLKQRYVQILNKEYTLSAAILDNNSSNEEKNREDENKMPIHDSMYIALGALYDAYADTNADFLNPVVKKILKKAYILAGKYNYFTESTTEDLIKINKVAYKRALDELAK